MHMSSNTRPLNSQSTDGLAKSVLLSSRDVWIRRLNIPLTILAWIAVIAVVFWAASHIVRSLLLLAIAALLAYALAPAVKFLQRVMPRILAILIIYLIVLGAFSLLIYLIVSTAIQQGLALAHYIHDLLTPTGNGQPTPLEQ